MIHLHLTKHFFEQIKNGTKKSEFRPVNWFYKNMISNFIGSNFSFYVCFYCGYPAKYEKEKIIIKEISDIKIVKLSELDGENLESVRKIYPDDVVFYEIKLK